jgi:hypothetical protein
MELRFFFFFNHQLIFFPSFQKWEKHTLDILQGGGGGNKRRREKDDKKNKPKAKRYFLRGTQNTNVYILNFFCVHRA